MTCVRTSGLGVFNGYFVTSRRELDSVKETPFFMLSLPELIVTNQTTSIILGGFRSVIQM